MDNKNFKMEPKTMTQEKDAITELAAQLSEGEVNESMLCAAAEIIAATIRGWKYTVELELTEEHRLVYAANEGAKVALAYMGTHKSSPD